MRPISARGEVGNATSQGGNLRGWRIGVVLAATVVFALLAIGASATHQTCESGEFCVWADTGYSPAEHFLGDTAGNPNWPCGVFCSPDVDNNEDSVKNRTSLAMRVYDGDSWTGAIKYCVDAGQWDSNINNSVDNDGNSQTQFPPYGSTCPAGDPGP